MNHQVSPGTGDSPGPLVSLYRATPALLLGHLTDASPKKDIVPRDGLSHSYPNGSLRTMVRLLFLKK